GGPAGTSTPTPTPTVASVTLSASPTSVVADGSVTATWSGIAAPNGQNRVGLYVPGDGDGNYLAWQNTGGAASGSLAFGIPATLAPGTYELRLFAEQFSGRLAISNAFTVTACTTATLAASPSSVPPGTSSITASWSGVCAPDGQNRLG